MPRLTDAQRRLMDAAINNATMALEAGIPQSVLREYVMAVSDDERARIFQRHFDVKTPELLKPRDPVNDFFAYRQSLLHE